MWSAQFRGALRKNVLRKQRKLPGLVRELLLPAALTLILFFLCGARSSYNARNYALIESLFPQDVEPVLNFDGDASSMEDLHGVFMSLLEGPLVTPTFDQFIDFSKSVRASTTNVNSSANVNSFLLHESRQGQAFANILTPGTLHFAPAGARVDELLAFWNDTTSYFHSHPTHVHASEADAVKYIQQQPDEPVWALVVLNEMEDGNVHYTLRLDYTTLPNTNFLTGIWLGLDPMFSRYYTSGFHTLARTIDIFAFSLSEDGAQDPDACVPPEVVSVPFPTPELTSNHFFVVVSYLLALLVAIGSMFSFVGLVRDLVEEKESRMRETMAAMGMSLAANGAAWFIVALGTFSFTALLYTIVACNSCFPQSDPCVIFLFFWLFGLSEIALAFLVSVFFSRAKVATTTAPVMFLTLFIPGFILFINATTSDALDLKLVASLLSPSAFALASTIIGKYEHAGVGVGMSNVNEGAFSLQSCLTMLGMDAMMYALLAAYLEQVLPTQHGTPRHPLFFLQPLWSALRGSAGTVSPTLHLPGTKVQVHALSKQWPGCSTPAINNLSLGLVEGQITCLLGSNGAGKSTLVSILAGLTPPSAGDASVYGHSLTSDLAAARSDLGVCPQSDVLFPSLTVQEHLEFFAAVRGLTDAPAATAVDELVIAVGLQNKRHVCAGALSGGMKRKLCLAQALIGNPRFVLLDEPTAGMDPLSRRAMWELLRQQRRNRVILLTTHFLDEAEILADQIAIVTRGQLRCAGSSLDLKQQFNTGYCLTLVLDPSCQPGKPDSDLTAWVQGFVPHAKLTSTAGHQASFGMPREAVPLFPSLLREIENNKQELGVSAFGISPTTLEEIFVQIGTEEGSTGRPRATEIELAPLTEPAELQSTRPSSRRGLLASPRGVAIDPEATVATFAQAGPTPWLAQVAALFHKRCVVFRRDRTSLIQLAAPLVVIALLLSLLTIDLDIAGPPIDSTPNTFAQRGVLDRTHVYVAPNSDPVGDAVVETADDFAWFREHDADDQPEIGMTSHAMSSYILGKYHNGQRRYGAFVFGDSIPFDVTVDWDETKPHVRKILKLIATLGLEDEVSATLLNIIPSLEVALLNNDTAVDVGVTVSNIGKASVALSKTAAVLTSNTSMTIGSTECTFNGTTVSCSVDGGIDDGMGSLWEAIPSDEVEFEVEAPGLLQRISEAKAGRALATLEPAEWISTQWDKIPWDEIDWEDFSAVFLQMILDTLKIDGDATAMVEVMMDGMEVAADGSSVTFLDMMLELVTLVTSGDDDTFTPTFLPSPFPTATPTPLPTATPTPLPTALPTALPTPLPTAACADDDSWYIKNKPAKGCEYVGKKKKKVKLRTQNTPI